MKASQINDVHARTEYFEELQPRTELSMLAENEHWQLDKFVVEEMTQESDNGGLTLPLSRPLV